MVGGVRRKYMLLAALAHRDRLLGKLDALVGKNRTWIFLLAHQDICAVERRISCIAEVARD